MRQIGVAKQSGFLCSKHFLSSTSLRQQQRLFPSISLPPSSSSPPTERVKSQNSHHFLPSSKDALWQFLLSSPSPPSFFGFSSSSLAGGRVFAVFERFRSTLSFLSPAVLSRYSNQNRKQAVGKIWGFFWRTKCANYFDLLCARISQLVPALVRNTPQRRRWRAYALQCVRVRTLRT